MVKRTIGHCRSALNSRIERIDRFARRYPKWMNILIPSLFISRSRSRLLNSRKKQRQKHVTIAVLHFTRQEEHGYCNKARILGMSCGMRERYFHHARFEHEYDSLSDEEKHIFVRLLQSDDGFI